MTTLLPLFLALVPQDEAPAAWPTFDVQEIEGYTVHVNEAALAEHGREMAAALEHLRWQLYATTLVLPPESLKWAREVPLWAEYETQTACMSFHPGRQWLLDRDYQPPDVPSVVELANATNFLSWTHHQPWMVLHELAHGLDFVHIGARRRYGEPTFDALWKEMEAGGRYESVRHWGGGMSRHYGLNNPMEHFAESTEAYFGINDFYPFVRAELREFDPATAKAIEARWGVDVEGQRDLERRLVAALEHDNHEPFGYGGVSSNGEEEAGWTVNLLGELCEDRPLCDAILTAVHHELHLAERYMPALAYSKLRDEWGGWGILVYLEGSGGAYINKLQIERARDFLAFKPLEPCVLIRELAGLWYDLAIHSEPGPRQKTAAALARAKDAKLYDSVLRFDGAHVPHPALRDARTFFAEMSEAYFLGNDHFPFVRAELMNHDPETFALLEELWHPKEKTK